jgi:hypothetical protein
MPPPVPLIPTDSGRESWTGLRAVDNGSSRFAETPRSEYLFPIWGFEL